MYHFVKNIKYVSLDDFKDPSLLEKVFNTRTLTENQ